MSNDTIRARPGTDRDEPDQWLLDAAHRAGHRLGDRERPVGTSAWRMLLSAGVPEEEVLRIACAASGTEPADFGELAPALATILPHSAALKHRVAPLAVRNGTLSIATSNPRNAVLERDLAFAARQRVRLYAASPGDVIRAQGVVYGTVYGTRGDALPPSAPAPSVTQPRPAKVAPLSGPATVPPPSQDDAPVAQPVQSDLLDRLLATACAERASDVVLEPAADGGLLVRLCVDGTLNDRFRIPAAHAERLVQSLRQRARLDESDRSGPQQGRMSCESPNGLVAVRVVIEALDGGRERVRLRLFSPTALLELGQLGYAAAEHRRLRELLGATSGLLIVAGPADAGKTTTMYAAARAVAAEGRSVATVEELIEYPLDQVHQTQLGGSASSAATQAAAVGEALAAPGDLLLIGAPLDAATLAECVGQGAETAPARLIVAALDTGDLTSTLERLVELHPDRATLARSLRGVVVQRLVRRLCADCAAPQEVSELPDQQQRLLTSLPTSRMKAPVGCATCRTTGYLGRTALAEVVVMTPELQMGLARGASLEELARIAQRVARSTLWESGIDRVLEGVTSLAEVVDAVKIPEPGGAVPQVDIDTLLGQLLGLPMRRRRTDAADEEPSVHRPSPVDSFTLVTHEPDETLATDHADATTTTLDVYERSGVDDAPLLGAGDESADDALHQPALPVAAVPSAARRVLIVNDDAAVRRELAHSLVAEGMQVLQVADGAVALTWVKRLRPDLVLTEVSLPGLDAVGLLTALGAEPDAPPVIVYTEQVDDALDAWLYEVGARTVLRRGVPLAELLACLNACVSQPQ